MLLLNIVVVGCPINPSSNNGADDEDSSNCYDEDNRFHNMMS